MAAHAPTHQVGDRRRARHPSYLTRLAPSPARSLRHPRARTSAAGLPPVGTPGTSLQPAESEIRFHTVSAATRLPRQAGQPGIWRDEPGFASDASLRGHCRIARWMKFRLACHGVRVPLRARPKRP
jgi:hypothetical protein